MRQEISAAALLLGSLVVLSVLLMLTRPPLTLEDQGYKQALATVFWVGEIADPENAYIPNDKSAWDSYWQEHYGGIDTPEERCGYRPCAFVPQENPFYIALPYNDLDDAGNRKASAAQIPWFTQTQHLGTVLKNTWVELRLGSARCYAQWQDVGPIETDDFAYVFGSSTPKNTWGERAGIDLSPAVRDCLAMESNQEVYWRFVNEAEVPSGPWKEVVTDSGITR